MQGVRILSTASHLVKRFFRSVAARSLDAQELDEIHAALPPRLLPLFAALQRMDQRHSYDVYERVGKDPQLAQAALLHDVGKQASRLGVVRRSCATVGAALHLRLSPRLQRYVDHGPIGAALLEEAGADPLAIAFTRHHPGPTPVDIDPSAWLRLSDADDH
ncbi:MAG: hypothetical protein KDB69_09105 [Acidimicrobiia bacterium]|nr:hypothetical protein [Acidimicrobiia bacterium]